MTTFESPAKYNAAMADPVRRTVVVGGTKIRVEIRPASGSDASTEPPLLLCNGIGVSLDVLDAFVERLDPRREVIRFDVPGVGGSSVPRRPYWMPEMARTLGSLVTKLGYQRVDILGISWGGGLAQQFAVLNPRRCGKLVLAATGTGCVMVPASPRVLAHMLSPRRHRDPEYSASIAGHIYGGSARADPAKIANMMQTRTRAGPGIGYLYQLLAGWGWTSLPFLPLIRQPTLVLAGDDDPIIPLINGRILASLIPHAELHVYTGGHLGLVTEAEELVPIIEKFLDS